MNKKDSKLEQAVRPARQKRSAATRDAILEVVEELVEAGEFDSSTVQDIVQRAGCSVGAFYGRFADKNAVLFSFYDTRCQALEARAAEVLDHPKDKDLWQILDAFIELIVGHTMDNEPFLRASQRHFSSDPSSPFIQRAQQLNSRLYASVRRLLVERRQEHTHPEPETAGLFVLALLGGLTRDALLTGRKISNRKMYAQAFRRELKRAVSGYLGIRAALNGP